MTEPVTIGNATLYCGDALAVLQSLEPESVQCVVTSPPYFGLRDYGHEGQIGLEETPQEYVAALVAVFREVRRVLRDDGTVWVNLGDSYNAHIGQRKTTDKAGAKQQTNAGSPGAASRHVVDCKPKDLLGIPWRVAFALQQPWVDWQIKDEAMRAWVAGIVDGEGCITIHETKSSHSDSLSYPPCVQVRMCDLDPLERLVNVVGSSYGKPQHSPSHVEAKQRPSWQWKVVSNQAARVIAEIYPFLTCKRKQAIVAWNHQMFRAKRGNQKRACGDIEKEQFCKKLINDLNQRKTVDLPSWMLEPAVTEEPGWYLRQDLIWHKPNPMPESVRDRCTKAHEYVFLLSKSARYYYDHEAIKDPCRPDTGPRYERGRSTDHKWSDGGPGDQTIARSLEHMRRSGNKERKPAARRGVPIDDDGRTAGAVAGSVPWEGSMANKRSVWTITTRPYSGAHFATFPPELPRTCILAGTKRGDVVLDPFSGAATTGVVAVELDRQYIGIDISEQYVRELATPRLEEAQRQGRLAI